MLSCEKPVKKFIGKNLKQYRFCNSPAGYYFIAEIYLNILAAV